MLILKKFFAPVHKYRYAYCFFLTLAVSINILMSYLSSYMNKYIFEGIQYQNHEFFAKGMRYGLLLLGLAVVYPFTRYFHIRLVRRIVYELKLMMIKRLNAFEMAYFDDNHSADAIQKISNYADSMKTSYFTGVYSVANNIFLGLFNMGMMIYLSWTLALISMVVSLVSVVLLRFFNKKIKEAYKEINRRMTHLLTLFSDILRGIIVIRMNKGASLLYQRYDDENVRVNKSYDLSQRLQARMDTYNYMASTMGAFGTIFMGVLLVKKGYLDYGVVMSIATLQISLSSILERIGSSFSGMMSAISRYEEISSFLEMDQEVDEKETSKEGKLNPQRKESEYAIELSKISFAYHSDKVFENLSMKIPMGSKCLIVGPSGKGKSTLFKLLLGFYPIEEGKIRIWGNDLEADKRKDIRKTFGYVAQDCYLFEGTIEENIGAFRPKIDRREIRKAAKSAGIDGYIESLEHAYETKVDCGGKNFSGGQRQRIAIARALYRNASILLLDEVTSALDSESEHHLLDTLIHLPQEVTVLMITHRVESVWNGGQGPWKKIYIA